MTTAKIDRPILRWHGGKWRLAPWIIKQFPPHRIYVEPYAGAASVLLRKPLSAVEVLNDRHQRLVNLFRVMRDPKQSLLLMDQLQKTPYAEMEYRSCREPADDPAEDARRLLVLAWQGHGSTGASGAGRSTTGWRRGDRGGAANTAREWAVLWSQVVAWADRLRGVYLECDDAREILRRWDAPDTLFYCDPPYPLTTRTAGQGYTHDLDDADHHLLAEMLHQAQGMVVLSSYPCPLYERLYTGWMRLEKRVTADAAASRVEVLWLNPAAACRRAQRSLFEEKAA